MKKLESFFELSSANDAKHILNTCNRPVPQEILDAVENGCSLETLEKLVDKKFDVFKYGTQITIHGLFPETSTRRIGGSYVNLVQNKNKSIGVRYNAIDRDKKSRLFELLQVCGWLIENNSQNYGVFKMERLPSKYEQQNYLQRCKEIVAKYKTDAEKIDRKLFIGNVECYLSESFFGLYVVLALNIRCFYEKDFSALFENLSGMTVEDAKELLAKKREEAKRKREEFERECKENQKKREEEKQENLKKFLAENPLPSDFVETENYVPQVGDIYAFAYSGYSNSFSWNICKVKKHGANLLSKPCDLNGEEKGKGNVIKGKFSGTYFVKRSAVEEKSVNMKISAYSSSSFILTGDTYPHRTKIKSLGGWWSRYGQGWIFPNTKENSVRTAFAL